MVENFCAARASQLAVRASLSTQIAACCSQVSHSERLPRIVLIKLKTCITVQHTRRSRFYYQRHYKQLSAGPDCAGVLRIILWASSMLLNSTQVLELIGATRRHYQVPGTRVVSRSRQLQWIAWMVALSEPAHKQSMQTWSSQICHDCSGHTESVHIAIVKLKNCLDTYVSGRTSCQQAVAVTLVIRTPKS